MLLSHQTYGRKREVKIISRLIFGFDIDGVLTNDDDGHSNIWLREASDYFGEPILKRAYYIEEAFNKTKGEVQEFFRARVSTIFQTVPVREHAAETLQNLRSRGHDIHLITARDEEYRQVTEDWLERHGIPYHSLSMRKDSERYSKGILCQQLGVGFFVDDKVENAEDTARLGVYTLLFHASHNLEANTSLPLVRSWREVRTHIELFLRNTQL